jgi:hypothetical protein
MNMFYDLCSGKLDIYRLNFAMLTLIHKENESTTVNKFRPISLLNCSYKNFTKVLTNRLVIILQRSTTSNLSAFLKGGVHPECSHCS